MSMGQLVDFMPTPFPQNTPAPFESRTKPGLMCGYAVQPGGKWAGDYFAVEYAPFQENPDLTLGQARKYIHRIKEVKPFKTVDGKSRFPLGERKAKIARLPPQLHVVDGSSVFDPLPAPEPSGDPLVAADDTLFEVQPNVPEHSADAMGFLQPDKRGEPGWSDAGQWTRAYAGSTRPPNIDNEIWKRFAPEDRQQAIAEYLEKLRTGSFITPVGPSSGSAGGPPAAGAATKKPRQSTSDAPKLIESMPLNIVFLEDGPSTVWRDAVETLIHKNQYPSGKVVVQCFDMLLFRPLRFSVKSMFQAFWL